MQEELKEFPSGVFYLRDARPPGGEIGRRRDKGWGAKGGAGCTTDRSRLSGGARGKGWAAGRALRSVPRMPAQPSANRRAFLLANFCPRAVHSAPPFAPQPLTLLLPISPPWARRMPDGRLRRMPRRSPRQTWGRVPGDGRGPPGRTPHPPGWLFRFGTLPRGAPGLVVSVITPPGAPPGWSVR